MLVLRQLHRHVSSASLLLLQIQHQQTAEAKCSHTEVKSLPLENHSSVAQLEKEEREVEEGGEKEGTKREKRMTEQEEERAFTVSKRKAAITEPPS